MLCWICPDCGRDCSPAVRECPFCTQQQASSPATSGVLALVEKLRETPHVPLLEAGSEQYLLFGLSESVTSESLDGQSTTAVSTIALAGEDVSVPSGEAIDSVVRQLVESAKTEPDAAPEPDQKLRAGIAPRAADSAPVQPPALVPRPLAIDSVIEKPTVNGRHDIGQPTPRIAPTSRLTKLPAAVDGFSPTALAQPLDLAPAARPPMKPSLLLRPSAKFVELPAPVAPPPDLAPAMKVSKPAAAAPRDFFAPADPAPLAFHAPATALAERPHSAAVRPTNISPPTKSQTPIAACPLPPAAKSVDETTRFTARPIQLPAFTPAVEPLAAAIELAARAGAITTALELQAETLLTEITAEIDARESAIRAIAATFAIIPACALLATPLQIVAAPADPDFTWKKTPRPAIPARKPPFLKYASLIAPAQKLPLAGPCLPPELQNIHVDISAEMARRNRRIGTPAWIVSLLIATALFLGAGTLMQRFSADRDVKSMVATPTHSAAEVRTAAPAFEPHPFARFVEVTGLRVVADANHRSQVQYIVVNHSSAELTGMAIKIAVRSSKDPAGTPPLFTVSAIVPSLAPHQSKEIRTDLDSELRASAIPDWEYLRTDVQVGSAN